MLLNLLFHAPKCDMCNRCHALNTKLYQHMMKEGFNSTGTAPLKVTAEKKMNTQLKQNVMQQKRFTV